MSKKFLVDTEVPLYQFYKLKTVSICDYIQVLDKNMLYANLEILLSFARGFFFVVYFLLFFVFTRGVQ